MVITNPPRFVHLLGLLGLLLCSCTAKLDELQTEQPDDEEPAPIATDHSELGETSPQDSAVPNDTNLGGTEGTSNEQEPAPPTCPDGLLNDEGFCVPEVHCAPGTFITQMNGNPACAPCASGSFSLDYDARECVAWKDCALGEFVLKVGTSSSDRTCEVCPEGESSTVMNAGECSGSSDCPAGSFKQGDRCEACNAGSYCSGKSDRELACEAGTWDDDQDPGTPCIVTTTCAMGQFVQDQGSPTTDQTCEFCPDETFSVETNAVSCEGWTTCAAGTHVEVQGTSGSDRVCAPCETGTFAAGDNAPACTSWSTCAAPTEYSENEPDNTTDRSCAKCPSGYSADADNASECSVAPPPNLVTNGDFETGTAGWMSWNGGVLSQSNAKAHSGTFSLLLSGPGTGPAATVLDAVAEAGATYVASFWVSVGKVSTAQVNLTRSLVCGGSTTYVWLADNSAVANTDWTNLTGSFSIPADCASPKLMVYAEGSGSNVDLYVDDVSVTRDE